jgi:hypothetical protein
MDLRVGDTVFGATEQDKYTVVQQMKGVFFVVT